jgi:hypothetical protein
VDTGAPCGRLGRGGQLWPRPKRSMACHIQTWTPMRGGGMRHHRRHGDRYRRQRAAADRARELAPGDALPPVRTLADELRVNRNTVVAAYRLLTQAGLVEARGRAGTRVAERTAVAQEGFARGTVLRDLGTGNPDPHSSRSHAPSVASPRAGAVRRARHRPRPGSWATAWMRAAVGDDRALRSRSPAAPPTRSNACSRRRSRATTPWSRGPVLPREPQHRAPRRLPAHRRPRRR